jgi:hypothetical protein
VTLYAVWGYDTDGNGTPDVLETWYDVLVTDENLSVSPDQVSYGTDPAVITITAASGYNPPRNINKVTVGGTELDVSDYVYDPVTGVLTINVPIDGTIDIDADAVPDVTITVTVSGDGSVTYSVDDLVNPVYTGTYTGALTVPTGSSVTLTGSPGSGWMFSAWSGDLATNENPVTVTVNDDMGITAIFTDPVTVTVNFNNAEGSITYTVDDGVNPIYSGTYTGPLSVGSGAQVTLDAAPKAGYGFSYWFGDLYGNDLNRTFTVNSDMGISAAFHDELLKDQYTLTLGMIKGKGTVWWSVQGSGYSLLTEDGVVFLPGDVVSLRTQAEGGHSFMKWTVDHFGKDDPTSFAMSSSKTVGADFAGGYFWYLLPMLILLVLLALVYWRWMVAEKKK